MFSVLLKKDLLGVVRERRMIFVAFGFALLLATTASIAFLGDEHRSQASAGVVAGLVTVVFLFSAVGVLLHSFAIEHEAGGFLGAYLLGVGASKIFLSKVAVNMVALVTIQVVVVLAVTLLCNRALGEMFGRVLPIAVLSSIGVSALGTFVAAMTAAARSREILFPVILFSLLLPLTAATAVLIRHVLEMGTLPLPWLVFLVVGDTLLFVLSWALFEFVLLD